MREPERRARGRDTAGANWLLNGRTFDSAHFSPLKEIHDQNVAGLGLAWCMHIQSAVGVVSEQIVVDGVAYVSAPQSKVYAVDAATGTHRWAEHYDRELEDVFAVQDEVARTIASILAAHVNKAEIQRVLLKPPASWQAYDCYLRANDLYGAYWSSFNREDLYAIRRLLELHPMSSARWWRQHRRHPEEDTEYLLEGARVAGLSE